jgi:signal transduction histidine kinase
VVTDRPSRRLLAGGEENRWLITGVVLAAVAAVTITHVAGSPNNGPRLIVIMVICGPLVLLRRWSLPVLCVVTVAAAMITASGAASLLVGLLLGLTVYFSALGLPRRLSIRLVLGVAVVLGTALVYAAFAARHAPLGSEAVQDFVPLAGAWFIADAVAARRRYQAGLAMQAERERAAEVREERVRIAREMHDVVAHTLAVITVQAGVGRRLASKRPEEANAALESIETIGRTAQEELRVVLGLLRDGDSGGAPLAPAPRLIDVKDLVDTVRASGTPVELRMPGTDCRLSPSLELSVYRVVQEALTNVVKHASGAQVTVEISVSGEKIRLDVCDDGGTEGGEARPADLGAGHGIVGMRERISAFGGWLTAEPDGDGFRVTAEVPM